MTHILSSRGCSITPQQARRAPELNPRRLQILRFPPSVAPVTPFALLQIARQMNLPAGDK